MVLLQQLYRRLLEQPCSTSEMKNMGDSCESGNRGESGEMGEMWKSALLITYQSIAAAAGRWLGKTRLVENLVKRTLSNLSVA